MSIDLVAETWNELKRFVNTVDRSEAAESLVSILVDNDFDEDDIRSAFRGDADIKHALSAYFGSDLDEEVEEDFEEFEDDEWDE